MKPNRYSPLIAHTLLLTAVAFSTFNPRLSTFAQGSLTPPGPPGPTMKTLDQVQPRTPIGDVHYTITQPGSYYLTANRTETVASSAGIWIYTNDVTLDLNGFTLRGGVYSQSGIYVRPGVSNIVISHGTVASWLGGGIIAAGIYRCQILNVDVANNRVGGISVGPDSRIIGCNVVSNSFFGIQAANNALIKDCLVVSNAYGISAGTNAAIENCQVGPNSGTGISAGDNVLVRSSRVVGNASYGISVGANAVIESCLARSNSLSGIQTSSAGVVRNCIAQGNSTIGISLGANSRVQDCTALQNLGDGIDVSDSSMVLNAQAVSNQGRGIYVNHYCQVSGCVANLNNQSGIYVFYPGCQVIGNTCAGNNISASTTEAGIFVDDSNNRVEGNHVTASGYAGISVSSSYVNNVIVRNTVSGNAGNNYLVYPANNDVGPIGTAATAPSPWANISH